MATSLSISMPRCSPTVPCGRAMPLEVRAPDGRWEAVWVGTFVDVGPADVLLFEDSSGALALAVSGGNAAELMDLRTDSEVTLRPLK